MEKHGDYLRGRQFLALPHPLEATAWENGFVPETHGLPTNELEPRMLPLLPQLSHMVSASRQPVAAGNALLTRFDANIRPYWLRDWQTSFGGYTKVYEYQCGSQTKRMYSVAYVVRPRTATSEACLCFPLMNAVPKCKPWERPVGQKDPSRSVLLDLKPFPNWQLPATVLDLGNDIAKDLTDDLQVQCLPVARSSTPKWTYRTLPKVTNFRIFGRLPAWGRKPQRMTYHLCAEDITKNCFVPNLLKEEQDDLFTRGALPSSSSARDRPPAADSLLKWSASLWINTLLEKHAWLSAGLVWMYGASQSADMGVYRDVPPETPEARA